MRKQSYGVMKKYSNKKMFVLLTGAASVALLSGCGDVRNPFGDQRSEQAVPGERHLPAYNQVEIQRAAQVQGTPEAASLPPSMLAVPHNSGTNYDNYSASTLQADSSSSSLGSLNPAPIKVAPALTVRKPLSENIYPGRNTTPVASVDQPSTLRTSPASVSPTGDIVPAGADEVVAEPSSGSSFFSRIFGSASDRSADNASGKKAEATVGAISDDEKSAPYAPLSSVPQRPSEFKSIKNSRNQDIQDLQSEHAYAQAQQQQLGNEPSQQQGVTAVEMPQLPVAEIAPAAHVPMPAASAPTNQQFPRTPQRGVDIMTQDDWNALQKARQLHQSLPQSEQNFNPAPGAAEAPAPRAPYWWEGWRASPSRGPAESPEPTDTIQDNVKNDNAPQSALPVAPEPVAVNQPEPGNAALNDASILSSPAAAVNSDEEQPHRASFLSRLIGRSSTSDVSDNAATAVLPPPEDSPKEAEGEKAISMVTTAEKSVPVIAPVSDTQSNDSLLPSPNIIKRVKYTPVPVSSGADSSSPAGDQ